MCIAVKMFALIPCATPPPLQQKKSQKIKFIHFAILFLFHKFYTNYYHFFPFEAVAKRETVITHAMRFAL